MRLDVIVFTREKTVFLKSVNGYVYFRNNYSKYFTDSSDIFARYCGKKLLGTWRRIPNRSTDFYRCEKVDSSTNEQLSLIFRSAYD